MIGEDDDRRSKTTPSHQLGQDLSSLSIEELTERITMLEQEIKRIEAARQSKEASRKAADSFFR